MAMGTLTSFTWSLRCERFWCFFHASYDLHSVFFRINDLHDVFFMLMICFNYIVPIFNVQPFNGYHHGLPGDDLLVSALFLGFHHEDIDTFLDEGVALLDDNVVELHVERQPYAH